MRKATSVHSIPTYIMRLLLLKLICPEEVNVAANEEGAHLRYVRFYPDHASYFSDRDVPWVK